MKAWNAVLLGFLTVFVIAALILTGLVWRGFSATAEPWAIETVVARTVRNLAIPSRARKEQNPLEATLENWQEGREDFAAWCASCHGIDGRGITPIGQNLYPRTPDLRESQTQHLRDGEIHYIIENGVQLTGMPAWKSPDPESREESWKLVLFIRSLRSVTDNEETSR